MYSHRGTFNIVFQVTTAAAVLAAAAYTLQNLLFIFLSSFQTHTSCSLNLKILLSSNIVRPLTTFLKIVKAYKRHLLIRMRVFAYMENIIFLRCFPSSGRGWARAGGAAMSNN
ncbi:hypothetical protein CIY_07150 [Butyrivibrio fibrisolvens 16/4]|nr:hypothetical protein CIY_07150 [Butyrivibrio fibrisolvens 16/4]